MNREELRNMLQGVVIGGLVAIVLAIVFLGPLAHAQSIRGAIVDCAPLTPGGDTLAVTDGQKALFILCMQSKGFKLVCRIERDVISTRCWDVAEDSK
jgi:hypothetical protein